MITTPLFTLTHTPLNTMARIKQRYCNYCKEIIRNPSRHGQKYCRSCRLYQHNNIYNNNLQQKNKVVEILSKELGGQNGGILYTKRTKQQKTRKKNRNKGKRNRSK